MEHDVGEMAAALQRDPDMALKPQAVSDALTQLQEKGYPLSAEQTRAIRYGTGVDSGRLAIIEGAAGAGKTTTLRPITDLHKAAGHTVLGAAVAWRTAVALAGDCQIRPYSVDALLRRASNGRLELDARTVVIVDEAGMLSVRQTHHLLQLATRHGCKLIFAGDTKQHQPIEAGPGLRLAREKAGGVRVDTIRRQQPDIEDVLVHVHDVSPEQARFQADLTSPQDQEKILADYRDMPNKPAFTPWKIAASQALRDGDAAATIAAYDSRGRFHVCPNLDATFERMVGDWERYRQTNADKSSLVIARTNDECQALSHIMRMRNLEGRENDERVVVQVAAHGRKTRPLEIANGDLLRIGTTMWEHGLYNGTIVEVTGLKVHNADTEKERVEIQARSEYGHRVRFHVDEVRDWFGNIRLGHGYAMTIASAQGRTVDAAFVLADDAPAASTIYPALTRHKEELDIYVDRERVSQLIGAFRPEDGMDKPITDEDVREHLARRWSRQDEKVAAHDHMSPAMRTAFMRRQPGGRGSARWLAANDNGNGAMRALAETMRHETAQQRYAAEADACARALQEVRTAYETGAQRIAREGPSAALQPEFRENLARHGQINDTVARLYSSPSARAVLNERIGHDEIVRLHRQFADGKTAVRQAVQPRRHTWRKPTAVAAPRFRLRGSQAAGPQKDVRERAERFFLAGQPLGDDDPATRYLVSRGLLAEHAAALRWRDHTLVRDGEDLRAFPALLVPLETHDGQIEAVHRIFLDRAGATAPIGKPRRTVGAPPTGGCWFGNRKDPERIAVVDTLENALAVVRSLPADTLNTVAVVATTSAARLDQVKIPTSARNVVLLQNRNAGGEEAWARLQERYRESAIAVSRVLPRHGATLHDELRTAGSDALHDTLAPLYLTAHDLQVRATYDRIKEDLGALRNLAPTGRNAVHAPGANEIALRIEELTGSSGLADEQLATLNRALDRYRNAVTTAKEVRALAARADRAITERKGLDVAALPAWREKAEQIATTADRLLDPHGPAWSYLKTDDVDRSAIEKLRTGLRHVIDEDMRQQATVSVADPARQEHASAPGHAKTTADEIKRFVRDAAALLQRHPEIRANVPDGTNLLDDPGYVSWCSEALRLRVLANELHVGQGNANLQTAFTLARAQTTFEAVSTPSPNPLATAPYAFDEFVQWFTKRIHETAVADQRLRETVKHHEAPRQKTTADDAHVHPVAQTSAAHTPPNPTATVPVVDRSPQERVSRVQGHTPTNDEIAAFVNDVAALLRRHAEIRSHVPVGANLQEDPGHASWRQDATQLLDRANELHGAKDDVNLRAAFVLARIEASRRQRSAPSPNPLAKAPDKFHEFVQWSTKRLRETDTDDHALRETVEHHEAPRQKTAADDAHVHPIAQTPAAHTPRNPTVTAPVADRSPQERASRAQGHTPTNDEIAAFVNDVAALLRRHAEIRSHVPVGANLQEDPGHASWRQDATQLLDRANELHGAKDDVNLRAAFVLARIEASRRQRSAPSPNPLAKAPDEFHEFVQWSTKRLRETDADVHPDARMPAATVPVVDQSPQERVSRAQRQTPTNDDIAAFVNDVAALLRRRAEIRSRFPVGANLRDDPDYPAWSREGLPPHRPWDDTPGGGRRPTASRIPPGKGGAVRGPARDIARRAHDRAEQDQSFRAVVHRTHPRNHRGRPRPAQRRQEHLPGRDHRPSPGESARRRAHVGAPQSAPPPEDLTLRSTIHNQRTLNVRSGRPRLPHAFDDLRPITLPYPAHPALRRIGGAQHREVLFKNDTQHNPRQHGSKRHQPDNAANPGRLPFSHRRRQTFIHARHTFGHRLDGGRGSFQLLGEPREFPEQTRKPIFRSRHAQENRRVQILQTLKQVVHPRSKLRIQTSGRRLNGGSGFRQLFGEPRKFPGRTRIQILQTFEQGVHPRSRIRIRRTRCLACVVVLRGFFHVDRTDLR